MTHETRFARSGGVHIAYQVVGDQPLDLVYVPGWVSHLDSLREGPSGRFVERLASFSRLILFDKRGTGLSDPVAELPTMEERMDDVRAVMDAAGSARAAVFGISEGAAMCALFAATYPERTTRLVLYGAYARRLRDADYPWAPTPQQRQRFFDAIEQGWGGVVDLGTLAPSSAGDEHFCRWWATYLRRSASPGAALALARMNSEIDIRHVLPAIRVPTLILHRTDDFDVDVGGARYMAKQIPGAKYVEMPGIDHLVYAGDQDAVLDEIEFFLTGAIAAPVVDRVLATLMVTEIVGAAALAARLGDAAWRNLLDAHESRVRALLASFRGTVAQVTPNGMLATFDGPARAIRCAVAIIEDAAARGLAVRAGLHSGECEIAQGLIRGFAVQIADRVRSRARPGEVVVTSTVKDLVAGSGIAFEEAADRLVISPESDWRLFHVVLDGQASPKPLAEGIVELPPSVLSRRELEIAALVARGLSNRQIAGALSISPATVERHVSNILGKLRYQSRAQIAAWAVAHDLRSPDSA